jgi:DNA-binding transcriptional LysR family regulator
MDRLKQMEAFVCAVESGSLAQAARTIGITPAMLGRRVDALERRLGVKLLHRSTRHLGVTEEGAVFVEQCKRTLGEIETAEDLMRAGRHTAVGHLRLTAPAGFGRRHVAPHAPAFLAMHPEVQVSFDLTDRVVDLTREGFDLGIRIGGAVDPDLVSTRLARNLRVVCAAPAYLERRGVPHTLDDLAQHECLVITPTSGQAAVWSFRAPDRAGDRAKERAGERPVNVRVQGSLDCNDGELLHRWAREGLGLAWRSTWEIQAELARGELVTVLDDFALPDYDILAVFPRQTHVPAKVRFFVDHLKQLYAAPDYWTQTQ